MLPSLRATGPADTNRYFNRQPNNAHESKKESICLTGTLPGM
jgi:hypothetical protein